MTYLELRNLSNNPELRDKIIVACLVACDTIREEAVNTANHTNRIIWVKATLTNPEAAAIQIMPMVLAQNKALTVDQVKGAADEAIQAAVDKCINSVAL
jgi:hypothetical protein